LSSVVPGEEVPISSGVLVSNEDGGEGEFGGGDMERRRRRDRAGIVSDVLLTLYLEGPLTKTALLRKLGLGRKILAKYVDGFLVKRGYVVLRELDGAKIYAITPSGFWYLGMTLLVDVDMPESRDLVIEAAKRLEEAGVMVSTYVSSSIGLPVDLEIVEDGYEKFPVLIGMGIKDTIARYIQANLIAAKRGKALLVLPYHLESVLRLPRASGVSRAFYSEPKPENIATAILNWMTYSKRGVRSGGEKAASKRIIV